MLAGKQTIPRKKLSERDIFDSKGLPRLGLIKSHMKQEGRLSENCALRIINQTAKMFAVS